MITYDFECEKGHKFELFRFGSDNLQKWKDGKLEIECPICKKKKIKTTKVTQIIAKGSGQFKPFQWAGI